MWMCLQLCKEEDSSPVSLDMYQVPFSMFLLDVGMGTMLSTSTCVVLCFLLIKSSFKYAHGECKSKRAHVF